ncbi:hypothetical protein B7939_00840 [Eggerthia catenaformis]|nr:hypothetical protein B7939_00840 [Eggerthia catenaformis]
MGFFSKLFKINPINQEDNTINKIEKSETTSFPMGHFVTKNQSIISSFESKMILHFIEPMHPDDKLKQIQKSRKAYKELEKFCNKSEIGKEYFDESWKHSHNSKSNDFDFFDRYDEEEKYIKSNYDKLVDQFNKDYEYKTIADSFEKKKHHVELSYSYKRVAERSSIYANSTDTYVNPSGEECIKFERTLQKNANLFKESQCPYCKSVIELPKRKKSCPFCKNKIYIVESGIKTGTYVLKEDDYTELKELKNTFNHVKKFDPLYQDRVFVDE